MPLTTFQKIIMYLGIFFAPLAFVFECITIWMLTYQVADGFRHTLIGIFIFTAIMALAWFATSMLQFYWSRHPEKLSRLR